MDALEICCLTTNLGDVRTLATHPTTTTYSALTEEERLAVGIKPGMVRISFGLEEPSDIVADVKRALDATANLA